MNTAALNAAAKILGSTDKTAIINACVYTLVAEGMELPQAFDMIMGEGFYAKMAGAIYDTLKARATA